MPEKKKKLVPDASFPSSLSLATCCVAGAWLETPVCTLLRGHNHAEGALLGRAVWELSPPLVQEGGWQPAAAVHLPGLQKPFAAAPCIRPPEKLPLLCSHRERELPGACP